MWLRICDTRLMHGWLNIDKPEGMTSHQVVARLRNILRIRKIGHAGTLDPLASGVLPIAIGEATKTVPFMMDQAKTYRFEIKWGMQTSTDDREGEIIATSSVRPSPKQIQAILKDFTGTFEQIPPRYSAIKIKGKPAYAYARAGKDVELKSRQVHIDNLLLLDSQNEEQSSFEVHCHKGTYVRSLARDMAIRLGTVGHVTSLRRTQVGNFHESSAILLENWSDLGHKEVIVEQLYPLDIVLDDILAIKISSSDQHKLMHGQAVQSVATTRQSRHKDLVLCVTPQGVPVALATLIDEWIRPTRVFNIVTER
ncbi:MAG: tRNA pseudouridine(55) synthase TruB [Pseudomonadota bacterium]